MKVRLLLLATLLNTITVSGQFTTPITDSIFEQRLINLGYDTGIPNGEVLTSIIDTIDTLDISGNLVSQIITLSGIEYFTSLRYIDCSENSIDSLNLNSNSQLKHINCSSNDMSILEINNLNNLDVLNCSFNDLTAIFLSPFLINKFLFIEFNFNVAGYSLLYLTKQYLNELIKYFIVDLSAYTGIVFLFFK